jgi:hypothetical protein
MNLEYITQLFDSYSFHFDKSLELLDYKSHLLVAQAVGKYLFSNIGQNNIGNNNDKYENDNDIDDGDNNNNNGNDNDSNNDDNSYSDYSVNKTNTDIFEIPDTDIFGLDLGAG